MKFTLFAIGAAALLLLSVVPIDSQRRGNRSSPFSEFHRKAEFEIGKAAPRMHLQDEEGVEHDLDEYLGQWVFIEFGSYT